MGLLVATRRPASSSRRSPLLLPPELPVVICSFVPVSECGVGLSDHLEE